MMSLDDLEPCLPCQEATWDLDMASLPEKMMDPNGEFDFFFPGVLVGF